MPLTAKDWVRLKDEAERVAMEMADHYKTLQYPIDAYFRTTVIAYYENGKIYDSNHFSTPLHKMKSVLHEAMRNNWNIKYDKEEKTFTFEKHYPSGMYRIATYIPYNKDAIEIDVCA